MRVHLNGGPWHDKVINVPDGSNHFHFHKPLEDIVEEAMQAARSSEEGVQLMPISTGTYSQVRNRAGEFEWDGWSYRV